MNKQEWEELQERYADFLKEEPPFSCPYPWHEEVSNRNEKKAVRLYERMKKGIERPFLWEEVSDYSCSQYRTETIQNIRLMALVWTKKREKKEETVLSEIIGAFDWMAEYGYKKTMNQTDNWWDWQIGVPLALLDCCFLLRKELGEKRIRQACQTVEHFSGRQTLTNPIFTGANLVWTAMISAMCGLLTEDEEELKEAKQAALKELHFVNSGDGFYRDGSFIQHEKLAYTGGYGISFMEQMSKMMVLLKGTAYAFSKEEYGILCYFLKKAFFPLTVNGYMMDMVCGREISRHFMRKNQAGKQLMDSMWRMSCCVDQQTAEWLLERTENWLKKRGCPSQFVHYDHMDRTVCRRENYSVGLAMYSSRIQNYEAINEENQKGYYTGNGMLYLYSHNDNEYDDNFWCTADMDYLPGTTVKIGSRPPQQHVQKSAFVGGIGMGICGVSVMEVTEEDFHVRKSWMFFEDSIVCLGNDMVCQDGILQTTLENRRFPENEKNLWLDESDGKTKWIFSKGNGEGKGRGFYFLHPAFLQVRKEMRTGTWTSINHCSPLDTVYSEHYLKIWMEHDVLEKQNTDYAYVLYPNISLEDLKKRENEIELLVFNDNMHVVWQKQENRIAGVCWDPQGGTFLFGEDERQKSRMRIWGPAVFLLEMNEDIIQIAAKNPLDPMKTVEVDIQGGGKKSEIVSGAAWRDGMESAENTAGADGYSFK